MMSKIKNLFVACSCVLIPLAATAKTEKEERKQKTTIPYWYFNVGYETPFMHGDMYSLTKEKTNFGIGPNIRLGYRFNSLFGLELKAMYARMKGYSPSGSENFVLGDNGMTYYKYTMVKGSDYSAGPDNLWGIWGENDFETINANPYSEMYSKVDQFQLGLMGTLNLNRLFMYVPNDRTQRFTMFLKPAIYANKYHSATYFRANDQRATKKYKSPISVGLGGELSLDWAISRHFGVELYTGIMWVSDQEFDGIRTIKKAKDDFTWSVGANLSFRFPTARPVDEPVMPIVPVVETPSYNEFAFAPFLPVLGERKVRKLEEIARFRFAVSKTNLRTDVGHNQVYIDKIDASFRKLQREKDITIKSIVIEGFASPEGSEKENIYLAKYRAKDVADFLTEAYSFPRSVISYSGKGENWDGLKEALKAWNNPAADKMLSIVNSNKTNAQKKSALKACGAAYKTAVAEIYPDLRMDKCVFTYEIEPYNLEQCIIKFQTNPELLSANEMIAVINQYPMFGEDFNACLDKAYKFFPENEMLACYKAAALLKENKPAKAMIFLNKLNDNATSLMLKGIAALQMGERAKGIELINKSKEMGNSDAEQNIEMLRL